MKFISTNLLIYSILFFVSFLFSCVFTRGEAAASVASVFRVCVCNAQFVRWLSFVRRSDGRREMWSIHFVDAEFPAFHVLCILRVRFQWCVAYSLSRPMHNARLADRQSRHGISLLQKLLRPLKIYDSHLISHCNFRYRVRLTSLVLFLNDLHSFSCANICWTQTSSRVHATASHIQNTRSRPHSSNQ